MESRYGDLLQRIKLQEGGLVEVWSLEASYRGWLQVISGLSDAGYEMSLTRNGVEIPISVDSDVFSEEIDDLYNLQVLVGGQIWTTQFSSPDVIDFQGSPDLIRKDEDIDSIVKFMEDVASFARRPVIFIPETLDAEGVRRYLTVEY
ncbi:hypothetical protein AB0L42_34470 [Streptomyces sp. NPDC052287]